MPQNQEMGENKAPDLANGKICYIEIPALDIERSAAFYRDSFDWNIRKRGDGAVAFDDGVGQVSGVWVTGRQPHDGTGLFIYIMVEDIEASVDAIISNGGEIAEPIDRSTLNVVAKFRDPAGNMIGLFEEPTLARGF